MTAAVLPIITRAALGLTNREGELSRHSLFGRDNMYPQLGSVQTTTLAAGLAKAQGQYGSNYPQMMAAAVLAVVPMIVIYVIFQKQFVEGIATSGGKL